jgi:MFS family permease
MQSTSSQRTILFVNAAHALDHFVLLIYPTAVLAIALELGSSYADLIGLSTGAFVAFGFLSLPVGWIADRVGRRNLLGAFFLGSGLSCIALAFVSRPIALAAWLFVLGAFASIYHPVGSAMIVSNAERLGRELGRNGVWGNLGAAFASGVTALLADQFGWRAAFALPGFVALGVGIAFLLSVPSERRSMQKPIGDSIGPTRFGRPFLLIGIFVLALIAGGMTFNIATIALPKVIDERLGAALPLSAIGTLATFVFVLGALTQLTVGRLIDRIDLPKIFVGLSLLQPVGFALAAATFGLPMLLGLVMAMAAIYGQVVINDAMIARYVAPEFRAKAFGLRYFLGFTVSGLAVPMIALLHGGGGFTLVLAVTAAFGAAIFLSAAAFLLLARASVPASAAAIVG